MTEFQTAIQSNQDKQSMLKPCTYVVTALGLVTKQRLMSVLSWTTDEWERFVMGVTKAVSVHLSGLAGCIGEHLIMD